MLNNLEDKFKKYCNSKNFEINQNQIIVIKKIQDYYKKRPISHIILPTCFASFSVLIFVATTHI